ncbi:MAG: Asp-tRNA(Asn)/Glu-tRNA(Gln) amidotransferase subunit GatC [Clostridiales bacterium]|nr:Asp-tRNA(Asn)/Glu-tRNA(Gln) amidotransferase subunit GatC [Clostridiales bacterium]
MNISKDDIKIIAEQSQLILSESELEDAIEDLEDMLEGMSKLSKLDVDNVEPTIQVLPIMDMFREDEIDSSLDRETILRNAPQATDDSFIVPKVVE